MSVLSPNRLRCILKQPYSWIEKPLMANLFQSAELKKR